MQRFWGHLWFSLGFWAGFFLVSREENYGSWSRFTPLPDFPWGFCICLCFHPFPDQMKSAIISAPINCPAICLASHLTAGMVMCWCGDRTGFWKTFMGNTCIVRKMDFGRRREQKRIPDRFWFLDRF